MTQGHEMEEKEMEIPKLAMVVNDVRVLSSQQPTEIEFTAHEKGTTNVVKLNGKDSLLIAPVENAPSTSVTISEGKLIARQKLSSIMCENMVDRNLAL